MAILLTSLALTALFLAQGTTGLLAAKLFAVDPALLAGGAPPAATRIAPRRQSKDGAAILARNIFFPAKASGDPNAATAAVQPFDPNAPLKPCAGGLRLVGTIVNERQPEWSFAVMGAGGAGGVLLYRSGQSLSGHEVVAINWKRVVMASSASYCEVTMFGPPEPAASAAAGAPVATANPQPSGEGMGSVSAAELDSGITRISDTQFTVQRGLVDKVLLNQGELMRSARVVPNQEGGSVNGLKIYGVRRDGLLGRIGIQNGDTLRTINGFDMSSPDSALQAYTNLRSANRLTLNIVRRGQTMTMDYNIQ